MPSLYTRHQGQHVRYYANLRDIGGGQVALKPPGSNRATTDEAEAYKLLAAKIEELEGAPQTSPSRLGPFVKRFIAENPGDVTEQWLHDMELRLTKAVGHFGTNRELETIQPKDVSKWLKALSHLAGGTQRHYLHALSSLYKYAGAEGHVPVRFNPVGGLYRKPRADKVTRQRTDEFFEIDDAARFLEAARAHGSYYEVIATLLLTGGRRKEVFGLLVEDIDFGKDLVHFRLNRYRGLKRRWSERAVPLWPQLREVLTPYVEALEADPSELLFPGRTGGMITDLRKPLREMAKGAKMDVPRLTKFRHTYATARLQTTDNGKPLSLWQVAKEMGHKTVSRVEDTYGHPNQYRPRGEVVEYML